MTASLLLVLVLAGCLGAKTPPHPASTPEFRSPTFDDKTGAIEGVLLDDQLRPIGNATLFLASSSVNATSDELGRFGFSHLAPGADVLVVQHPFYETVQKEVRIVAGERANLRIVMVPIAIPEPIHLSQLQDGIVGCSVTFRRSLKTAQNCGPILAAAGQQEKSVLTWTLRHPMETLETLVMETSWKGGSPMEMFWSIECGGENGGILWIAGRSILKGVVNDTRIDEYVEQSKRGCQEDGFKNACPDLACKFQAHTFGSTEPAFAGAPQEFSYTYQQRFSQALTEFHLMTPEETFSAFPDS